MKLYYSPGACSLASHIALIETGADYTLEKTDLAAKTTESGEDFTKINPNGYVPALALDSGEILTEGPAILQFIADRTPGAGIAPENGGVERARVNGYLNFIGSELHKAFSPFFAKPAPEGEARAALLSRLGAKFHYLDNVLSDGRSYLNGDTFSIADAYLFVVTNWSNFLNIDITPWPHVAALAERVAARPATQKALEEEGLLANAA